MAITPRKQMHSRSSMTMTQQKQQQQQKPSRMGRKRYNLLLVLLATMFLQVLYYRSSRLGTVGNTSQRNFYSDDDDDDDDDVVDRSIGTITTATTTAAVVSVSSRGGKDNGSSSSRSNNSNNNNSNKEKGLVFVHLGKTAGSTITCMLGPSLEHAGKGNSKCDYDVEYRPSFLSESVVWRVHLVPAPLHRFNDFLITLRNPIDRIVSWYYFIHPRYPPELTPYHIEHCESYHQLFDCYDSMRDLAGVGLNRTRTTRRRRRRRRLRNNNNNNKKKKKNHETKLSKWCPDVAREMVTGQRNCFHNRYNYNFTYGDLLREAQAQQQSSESSGDDESNEFGNDNDDGRPTIYAIRTEHLEEDWKTIDRMLGEGHVGGDDDGDSSNDNNNVGSDNDDDYAIPHKNMWNNKPTTDDGDDTMTVLLTAMGRSNLCRVLCHEIQIYKGLLREAVNIDARHEAESLDELLRTCPEETREIRECPPPE